MPIRKQVVSSKGAKAVTSLSNKLKREGEWIKSCEESDEEATSEHKIDAFELFVHENLDQSGVVLTEHEEKLVQVTTRIETKEERTKYASVGDVESCQVSDQEASSEDEEDEYFYYDEDEMEDFEYFVHENLDQSGFDLTEDEEKEFESFVHENLDHSGFDLTEDEEKLIQEQIDYTLNFSEI